jgi:hypothetical protein
MKVTTQLKTLKVKKLKETVNQMLSQGVMGLDYRMGAISLLESVLLDTGNYDGYRYLQEREVPVLQQPGIREGSDFNDTDPSRRYYY